MDHFYKKRLGRVSKEFGIEANTTTYLSDTKRLNTLEPLNRRYHIFAAPNFAAYTEHQNFIVQGGLHITFIMTKILMDWMHPVDYILEVKTLI